MFTHLWTLPNLKSKPILKKDDVISCDGMQFGCLEIKLIKLKGTKTQLKIWKTCIGGKTLKNKEKIHFQTDLWKKIEFLPFKSS